MNQYITDLDQETKAYFKILSKEFPIFIYDYIETEEMQRLDKISQICGCYWRKKDIYTNLYSVLKHSIGVALIVWNFTKDKKQTISALLHDISTPAFKHCIDFLNGDSEKQESTEELTSEFIKKSKKLMTLLERDNIKLEEVNDYKMYPIADNSTPKLSADRLEYTFMNGRKYKEIWSLKEIEEIYSNIEVQKNEEKIEEIGFKDIKIAERFIHGASQLWKIWTSNEDTITMNFFADILRLMFNKNYITEEQLYMLSEEEIMKRIENCEDISISNNYNKFKECNKFYESNIYLKDKYCVNSKTKKRYINPLINGKRIYNVSNKVKQEIDNFINLEKMKYIYINEVKF